MFAIERAPDRWLRSVARTGGSERLLSFEPATEKRYRFGEPSDIEQIVAQLSELIAPPLTQSSSWAFERSGKSNFRLCLNRQPLGSTLSVRRTERHYFGSENRATRL